MPRNPTPTTTAATMSDTASLSFPSTRFPNHNYRDTSRLRFSVRSSFSQDDLKRLATEKAVSSILSGMILGLGTGSTAASGPASSPASSASPPPSAPRSMPGGSGIPLSVLDDHPRIDLAIDGADEVDPDLNLVKGRGGALLREKMVEAVSKESVVIIDETKLVDRLVGSGLAMPVEVVQFCWKYNLIRLQELFKAEGCEAKLRLNDHGKPYVTDNFNYIVDLYLKTSIKDGLSTGKEISSFEGVIEHGLVLNMATSVIIAGTGGVSVKTK